MKPQADEESILTGDEAVAHMTDTWQNVGMGMVSAEIIGPWFIVDRSGGNYRTFISLVDDTVVTILNGEATTRHIPEDLRPDQDVDDETLQLIGRAFNGSGGMYPVDGGSRFEVSFIEDETRYSLQIHTDKKAVYIVEE